MTWWEWILLGLAVPVAVLLFVWTLLLLTAAVLALYAAGECLVNGKNLWCKLDELFGGRQGFVEPFIQPVQMGLRVVHPGRVLRHLRAVFGPPPRKNA